MRVATQGERAKPKGRDQGSGPASPQVERSCRTSIRRPSRAHGGMERPPKRRLRGAEGDEATSQHRDRHSRAGGNPMRTKAGKRR